MVSSRTYLSTLERGLKSPTIDKLQEIADVMNLHPASLVLAAFAIRDGEKSDEMTINRVVEEARRLLAETNNKANMA